jgi:hypothetical protein
MKQQIDNGTKKTSMHHDVCGEREQQIYGLYTVKHRDLCCRFTLINQTKWELINNSEVIQ